MRIGLCLLFALSFSAGSHGAMPPLITAEYEIRAGSWEAHLAESEKFATELKKASEKLNIGKGLRAEGYYEIGKVFERYLGHHDLTFLFYERARRYLDGGESVKRGAEIRADIEQSLQRLAARKFEQFSQFADPKQEWPAGWITVIPPDNVIMAINFSNQPIQNGDFLLGELRGTDQLFESQDDLHVGTFGDIIGMGKFGFYLDVSLNELCSFESRHNADACWWVQRKRIRALVLSPPGYTVSVTYSAGSGLGAMVKSDFRNFWHVDQTNEQDVSIVKAWEFKEAPNVGFKRLSLSERLAELDDFLARFPGYIEQAKPIADDLFFAGAVQRDTITAYREYLSYYPEGRNTTEATIRLEKKRFDQILTIDDAKEFIGEFPEGSLSGEAMDLLDKLLFEQAVASRNINVLQDFLTHNPDTPHRAAVLSELDRLRFLETRDRNTIEGYQQFISSWPESDYLDKAKIAIDEIRNGQEFSRVLRTNSRTAYEDYLVRYPESAWADEARAMIAFFEAKSSDDLSAYEHFFDLRRMMSSKAVAEEEYRLLLVALWEKAELEAKYKDRGALAHVLAYRETGEIGYLRRAFSLKLINTPTEELTVLQRLRPEELVNIFFPSTGQSDPNLSTDYTWFWQSPIDSVRPVVQATFSSIANYRYRLEVELRVEVDYERYFYGITWIAPKGESLRWREVYNANATVEVGPTPSSPVKFQFPRFEIFRQIGPSIYSYRTEGTAGEPTLRILRVELLE